MDSLDGVNKKLRNRTVPRKPNRFGTEPRGTQMAVGETLTGTVCEPEPFVNRNRVNRNHQNHANRGEPEPDFGTEPVTNRNWNRF